mmetsp:Transcript_16509/g.21115  ORF Transcript_16509/g.21115 Transcript_16509/m.21115 type:complete len:361 (-) Transcript_16509:251-1333(-)
MPCLEIWPLKPCGGNGHCVTGENGTEDFCECDEGWGHSLEVNFFTDEDSIDSSVCNFNQQVIKSLYITVIILAVCSSLLQLSVLDNRKRFKRQMPFLTFSAMIIGGSIYRILNPETALLAVDLLFSFVVAVATSLPPVQSYILVTKYLNYMSKKVLSTERYHGFAEKATKAYFAITLLSAVSLQWLWIVTVVDVERRNKLVFLRVMLGINALRLVYQIAFISIALTALIRDMQGLLDAHSDTNEFVKVQNPTFLDYIQRKIPSTKAMRNRLVVVSMVDLNIFFWGIPFDIWVLAWTYTLPSLLLLTYFYSLTVIVSKIANEHILRNVKQQNQKDTASIVPVSSKEAVQPDDLDVTATVSI